MATTNRIFNQSLNNCQPKRLVDKLRDELKKAKTEEQLINLIDDWLWLSHGDEDKCSAVSRFLITQKRKAQRNISVYDYGITKACLRLIELQEEGE